MAVDREREVAMGHAAAVVGDADPPPSAAVGEDVDPAGAGVDGVFNEFLDHARGAFDHLAGGDAVDDLFGKLADGHGLLVADLGPGRDSNRAVFPVNPASNIGGDRRTESPAGRLYGARTCEFSR